MQLGAYERFEIRPVTDRQFRVFDQELGQETRGRFHTREAARDWIEAQVVNIVLAYLYGPRVSSTGRPLNTRVTRSDYYGDNERAIRAVSRDVAGDKELSAFNIC